MPNKKHPVVERLSRLQGRFYYEIKKTTCSNDVHEMYDTYIGGTGILKFVKQDIDNNTPKNVSNYFERVYNNMEQELLNRLKECKY